MMASGQKASGVVTEHGVDITKDVEILHSMGYAQELSRRMGGFQNFAISFSIICILAGGITAFQSGFSGAGGASIGYGWPIGCAFSLIVAASIGQIGSAYPTAGGLYHWSSILGGRGWGWATAWFNLLGLIFVVSSVDVGTWFLFLNLVASPILGLDVSTLTDNSWHAYYIQAIAIIVIVGSQAIFNHVGIRATTILTDFSGYLIFAVAIVLTLALLATAPSLDFSRLFTFTNNTGDPGGGVWPQTGSLFMAFMLGLLLPLYTVTGFDASAHTSEETRNAQRNVPLGMLRSVWWSFLFGYFMICAFVLAMPDVNEGAKQGANVFYWLMGGSTMPVVLKDLIYIGIVIANYLCALAGLTSLSRMIFAFARDGGFPASKVLRFVSPTHRTPTYAIWVGAILAFLSTLYSSAFLTLAAGCAVFLYLSYAMPVAAGMLAEGKTWTTKGPFSLGAFSKLLGLLTVLGALVLYYIGVQPPNDKLIWYTIGLLVIMAVLWFGVARQRFPGPPIGEMIAKRQAEIAAEERAVGAAE